MVYAPPPCQITKLQSANASLTASLKQVQSDLVTVLTSEEAAKETILLLRAQLAQTEGEKEAAVRQCKAAQAAAADAGEQAELLKKELGKCSVLCCAVLCVCACPCACVY